MSVLLPHLYNVIAASYTGFTSTAHNASTATAATLTTRIHMQPTSYTYIFFGFRYQATIIKVLQYVHISMCGSLLIAKLVNYVPKQKLRGAQAAAAPHNKSATLNKGGSNWAEAGGSKGSSSTYTSSSSSYSSIPGLGAVVLTGAVLWNCVWQVRTYTYSVI
jgi:hypothetical protein